MSRPATSALQIPSASTKGENPMSLRQRGPTRSATFAEGSSSLRNERRNSTLSDSVSEARNSIRSSTDDLFFPRAAKQAEVDLPNEESHWHSAPLGLALLPAIAGVFFQNGSAVVTDVTLLVLAAIFLNWSVRLPWDWYRSAQAVRQPDRYYDASEISPVLDPDEAQSTPNPQNNSTTTDPKSHPRSSDAAGAACRELQVHELAALVSCFVFPMIGTWLLHTIRSKLSRPSEGLVSNYNLTIFLLAAEIRPFSHLLKMVQARTLHLQRIVALSTEEEDAKVDISKIIDITKRLEELEAHVSEAAAERLASESSTQSQENTQSVVSQATGELRKGFQPEVDALTRAVRRYEKRTATTNFQTESRFQALQNQVNQAISLAAAANRTDRQRRVGFIPMLFDWMYAAALIPIQLFMSLTALPWQGARWCLRTCQALLMSRPSERPVKGKTPQDRKSRSPRQTRRLIPADQSGSKGLKSIRENKF
ncbi:hypothetical protein P170DRAFT_431481 [Aspergillus steynii IBT 23096]|uniref:Uncharacterized protein n=1 Tax=Aspergillus steynii IBT 23096 TaxID=1392250 RepID=A0A2I2GL98_9EURO|nr:uncharacterized protein P170DRAFT_431481 [Aspergillus steynii IBT 23096]PLB53654.1 hypothetical protein P170DRAFT_431481 [Aspergillus steynii IBT 23096]